ncbi:hypothetical protein Glove_621g43 [Diversispora epigaea]|uniref:Retrotransposon gag domain-containing protein n=1 Tax=Diversispora epigaea TaxID=1348612 RepID=A0A397G630_9GLOM|nr:hypothetical protein Glove_621g43 [Diversispora epigaea]
MFQEKQLELPYQVQGLHQTIAEITEIYNQKIEEIINYAEEQRNNEAHAIIDPREVQGLRHIRAQINCLTQIRDNCLQILYDLEWLQDSYIAQQRNRSRLTVNIPRRRHPLYQDQQQPVRPSLNTLFPPRSPPLLAQIQRGNIFPEGQYDSDFEIEYRPIINPPRNRNIEEDQDIEAYNNENLRQFLQQIHEPEPQLIAERNMTTFVAKPSKFSGTPNEDAQEWLQEFLVAAKANRWDDDRKRTVFDTYLKREPHNNAHTWAELRVAFITNHCTDDWREQWQEKLRSLKQRRGETVEEYFHQVEDNNAHTWAELRVAFITNHCTDDWREQWQEKLRSLKQRRGETVEEYFHQVRKLSKRANLIPAAQIQNPNAEIPNSKSQIPNPKSQIIITNLDATYTLPYFVRGLLPNIKAIVKTHEPADLATAYGKAKAYKQEKNEPKRHSKKTFKYESSSAKSSDSSNDEEEKYERRKKEKKLKKKQEKKEKKIPDTEFDDLVKRFDKLQINFTQQLDELSRQVRPRNRFQNRFQEQPHEQNNCLSEKKKSQQPYNRNVSYIEQFNDISEDEYETYKAIRNKPDTRANPIRRSGRITRQLTTILKLNQSTSVPKIVEPEVLVDFEEDSYTDHDLDVEMKNYENKKKTRIIDKLKPYDISEDILQMQASAKIEKQTTTAKCYVRIEGNPIAAVLDSGAAVSIITNKLRRRLGLEIDRPSKVIVIVANGIVIQDLLVPMQLQLTYDNKETIVATTHSDQLVPYIDSEEEYEEEIQDELEYELENDLEELESYYSEQVVEEDDIDEYYYTDSPQQDYKRPSETFEENPAVFLTNITTPETKESPIQKGILNEQQEIIVDELFAEYTNVFAENISEEGQTIELTQAHVVKHEIKTNAQPIKQ